MNPYSLIFLTVHLACTFLFNSVRDTITNKCKFQNVRQLDQHLDVAEDSPLLQRTLKKYVE